MPVVRVLLREGQEKLYYDAQASIHTPDRTLRITRNQDSIAEFQSEYYQYWEYTYCISRRNLRSGRHLWAR